MALASHRIISFDMMYPFRRLQCQGSKNNGSIEEFHLVKSTSNKQTEDAANFSYVRFTSLESTAALFEATVAGIHDLTQMD